MLDYKLPYHVLQEADEEVFIPKISFQQFEDAKEFVKFAPNPNLIIVSTKELKNYFIGLQGTKYKF